MQALMRTVMGFNVGSYLQKLREHERRVLDKRREMESDPKKVSSFHDVLKLLSSSSQECFYDEDELKEKIRVNGRSVSFIIDGEEYILKIRKRGEDMRDHAEIACSLEDREEGTLENYGAVFYGHLSLGLAKNVHALILDRSKNPRISLSAEDLTGEAVLFKVNHPHYFEYLSGPGISFDDFKKGLRKTMEQSFRHIRDRGGFMETLSDIAHDENRPGIFLPMVYFIDYINGFFLGTFLDIKGAYFSVDACEEGVRDFGNMLTCRIEEHMPFATKATIYLRCLYDQMKKDGEEKEFEEMILTNNMQESLAHILMTASNLFLIRLADHNEELKSMTADQFVEHLEDVVIRPFLEILGSKESVERLRPFYQDMLKEEFEDFKAHPHHFEYTSSAFHQGDFSRNNYYQSFYKLTYLLMSFMSPQGQNQERETAMDVTENESLSASLMDDGFSEESMDVGDGDYSVMKKMGLGDDSAFYESA